MEKSCLKKICFLLFSFMGVLFTSCEVFNKPVAEFLDYYTSEVIPADISFSGDHYLNKDGIECIPSSDETYTLTVSLINLKQRNYVPQFDLGENSVRTVPSVEKIYTEYLEDTQTAKIVFDKNVLQKIDNGQAKNANGETTKNVSGTLTLYQQVGDALRPFANPLKINLKVNSKPEEFVQPCVQADGEPVSSGVDDRNMVICFKMKDMKGTVHENDTHDLWIANDHFTISYENGTTNFISDSTNTGLLSKSVLPDGVSINPIQHGGFEFDTAVDTDYFNVYYVMNDIVSGNTDKKYQLKISDDDGLSSVSVVTPKSLRLNDPEVEWSYDYNSEKVSINFSHDKRVYNGTDVSGNYVFENEKCKGTVKLSYSVCNSSGDIVKSGLIEGVSGSVELDSGNYTVKVTAKCEQYIDSAETSENKTFSRSLNYYVNPDSGSHPNGSKKYPYTSVSDCISNFASRTDVENDSICNIYLLNNITCSSADSSPYASFSANSSIQNTNYILDGNDHTLNLNCSDSESRNAFKINSNATVVLKNIKITDAKSSEATIQNYGTLYLSNGTEITNNKSSNGAVKNYGSSPKGKIYIEGNVRVINNTNNNKAYNIVLDPDELLYCTNIHLDDSTDQYKMDNAKIGVHISTGAGQTVTTNFKNATDGNGTESVFTSDNGYSTAWAGIPSSEIKFFDKGVVINTYELENAKVGTDRNVISIDSYDKPNRVIRTFVTVAGKRIEKPGDWVARIYKDGSPVSSTEFKSDFVYFDESLTSNSYEIQIKFTFNGIKYSFSKTVKAVTPTTITTLEDFKDMFTDSNAQNKIFKLNNSIEIPLQYDVPEEFHGIFDGCGNVITVPKHYADGTWDAGIVLNNYGVIENVKIAANSDEIHPPNGSTNYAGVAFINYGTISNVQTTGTMNLGGYGSIAGVCVSNRGLIENCVNQMNIKNGYTNPGWAGRYGIIAGIATENGTTDGGIGIIRSCINYGKLHTVATYEDGQSMNGRSGSIVGSNNVNGYIENCYWNENCVTYQKGSGGNGETVYLNSVGFYTGSSKFISSRTGDELYGAEGRITQCGSFSGVTITAGTAENCKVNQTIYNTNLIEMLNSLKDTHKGYSGWAKDSYGYVILTFVY